MFEVIQADRPALVSEARLLIEEYAASLGVDLDFQEFEHELADGRCVSTRSRRWRMPRRLYSALGFQEFPAPRS